MGSLQSSFLPSCKREHHQDTLLLVELCLAITQITTFYYYINTYISVANVLIRSGWTILICNFKIRDNSQQWHTKNSYIFTSRLMLFHNTCCLFGFDLCELITFCVSRRRRKMYCGHERLCVCLSVCLSAAVCPHYCTDPDVTWESGRGCP